MKHQHINTICFILVDASLCLQLLIHLLLLIIYLYIVGFMCAHRTNLHWMDAPLRRLIALSFADSFVSDGFIKTQQQRVILLRSSRSNKTLFIDDKLISWCDDADDFVAQETYEYVANVICFK